MEQCTESSDTVNGLNISLDCNCKANDKKRKLYWDRSNANKIAAPKAEEDLKVKMKVFLELYEYLTSTLAPGGILLDPTRIHINNGLYREDIEFEKTKKILGKGISAGGIEVIKDKTTGIEHALKRIFRPEEIKAWMDLNGKGISPELYMFRLDGSDIAAHMEILDNAITLKVVIDVHMSTLILKNRDLMKPFSMFILNNILNAIQSVHENKWTHGDIHSENFMIQKKSDCEVKVKLVDYGNARRITIEGGYAERKSDVLNGVRIFSALYLGEEFYDLDDLKTNWREKIEGMPGLSPRDKGEMLHLFGIAMNVNSTNDIEKLKETANMLGGLDTDGKVNQIMKEVVPLLFPVVFEQNKDSESDRL